MFGMPSADAWTGFPAPVAAISEPELFSPTIIQAARVFRLSSQEFTSLSRHATARFPNLMGKGNSPVFIQW
jgi:hypothetical protein